MLLCMYLSSFSRLESRFFDRVAATNRVKPPTLGPGTMSGNCHTINIIRDEREMDRPPTPPWLRPPKSYKPKGKFAEKTAVAAARATAALQPPPRPAAPPHPTQKVSVSSTPPLVDVKSDAEKAMEAITRSASSLDRLSTAASKEDTIPRSESALEQLARTASGEWLTFIIECSFLSTILENQDLTRSSPKFRSCQVC